MREKASKLINSDCDLELANFHRNRDELSTHLLRLRVYFENMTDYLNEDTVNVPAHQLQEVVHRHERSTETGGFQRVNTVSPRVAFSLCQNSGTSRKIHKNTLTRRWQSFQIHDEEEINWSSAGNGELREIMQEIMSATPGIGQTSMLDAFPSRGIRVRDGKSEK